MLPQSCHNPPGLLFRRQNFSLCFLGHELLALVSFCCSLQAVSLTTPPGQPAPFLRLGILIFLLTSCIMSTIKLDYFCGSLGFGPGSLAPCSLPCSCVVMSLLLTLVESLLRRLPAGTLWSIGTYCCRSSVYCVLQSWVILSGFLHLWEAVSGSDQGDWVWAWILPLLLHKKVA